MGQGDVHADIGRMLFGGAAVGRFHDAGAAASADVEAVFELLGFAELGHQARKAARGIVVAAGGYCTLRHGNCLGIALGLSGGQQDLGLFRRHKAGAAKHHHGVVDALGGQLQVGLEHLQLKADRAGLAAAQKLRVCKGQAVRVALGGLLYRYVGTEQVPVMRHDLFVELGVGVHGLLQLSQCQCPAGTSGHKKHEQHKRGLCCY